MYPFLRHVLGLQSLGRSVGWRRKCWSAIEPTIFRFTSSGQGAYIYPRSSVQLRHATPGYDGSTMRARQSLRGGIALNNDPGRPNVIQHLANFGEQPRAQMIERLIGRHDVEIEVGNDVRQLENLVEQLPMLCRRADRTAELFSAFSRLMTGNSLMASGRVPKRTRNAFARFTPRPGENWGEPPCSLWERREGFAEPALEPEFGKECIGLGVSPPHPPWFLVDAGKAIQAPAAAFEPELAEFHRQAHRKTLQLP